MYLHLGKNVIIHLEDVIAIIDINLALASQDTSEFIKIAEEEGFITKISHDKPKSIVITEKSEDIGKKKKTSKSVIYFSPISSSTLSRRAGFIHDISVL